MTLKAWLILFVLVMLMLPAAAMAFDGEGTEDNPYLIRTKEDLKQLAQNVNNGTSTYQTKHFKLTANIDLENEEWTPIGKKSTPFSGHFHGDNHIISNLKITGNNNNVGLFGWTTNGSISNVTIHNAQVSGNANVVFLPDRLRPVNTAISQ